MFGNLDFKGWGGETRNSGSLRSCVVDGLQPFCPASTMTLLWTTHYDFNFFLSYLISDMYVAFNPFRPNPLSWCLFYQNVLLRSSSLLAYWCPEHYSNSRDSKSSVTHFCWLGLNANLRISLVRLREVSVACDPKYFLMLLTSRKCSFRALSKLYVSKAHQWLQSGKRNGLDWLKCLLPALKPDSELQLTAVVNASMKKKEKIGTHCY